MKDHLCLVCGVLAGITILHFIPFVRAAKADSTAGMSTPSTTTEQSSKEKILNDCRREWRADGEAMMKRDMTEDTYVEQCSVRDDVPAIAREPKPAPSAAPQ